MIVIWGDYMIGRGEKYGCLTVLDNGEGYVDTELYLTLKEKAKILQDKIQPYIDELKEIRNTNPEEFNAYLNKEYSACGSKIISRIREVNGYMYIEKMQLEPILIKLEKHYKCKCECGKVHFFNEETIESKPKYCFYPIPIATKHTYSIKAQNATYNKRKKYAKQENVVLIDKAECVPSEKYCDKYNKYRKKQLLKNDEKLKEEIAAIPRKNAKNYDVDFTGLQYESLLIEACVNDHYESEPHFSFSQQHKKIWATINVYKQYRCKCKLCGAEQLITCDRFGIYPPTEYGYHAYYGYWSDVYCTCHEISSFQWIVCKLLIENRIDYEVEFSFSDLYGIAGKNLLRFDFAIKDDTGNLKYLIECQGEQHYQPVEEFGGEYSFEKQKMNDELKRDYASKHGIPLLEIPYNLKKYESVKNLLISKDIIRG